MTPEEVRAEAEWLIRDLTSHAGNRAAVTAALLALLEDLDGVDMALVAVRAVEVVFSDCLSRVPNDELHAGQLTLNLPKETTQ